MMDCIPSRRLSPAADAGTGAAVVLPQPPRAPSVAAAVGQLAREFAAEPELILACLEGIDQTGDSAQRLYAAARQAVSLRPTYADLSYCAARAAVAAGDVPGAEHLLQEARRRNPDYLDALVLAGRLALERNAPAEACTWLEHAITSGADYPDVHLLLGDAWRRRENWPRARAAYERALQLKGNLVAARTALAALPATDGVHGEQ